MGPASESRRSRFQKWFRVFDVNHDGYIDEKDFVQIFERVASLRGVAAPSPEMLVEAARVRFTQIARADADGDGRVDEGEYVAAALAQRDPGEGEALDVMHEAMMRGGFASFDVDGDGAVNLADYVLSHAAFGLNPRVADVIDRFRYWDLNRDGRISLEEYAAGYRRHQLSDEDMPFFFCID